MGFIGLEKMEFYAYHGVYSEETLLGGWYAVDLRIQADWSAAAAEDDISKTINYETLYQLTKIQMSKPVMLLETLLENIVAAIKHRYDNIEIIELKIYKKNPPLGGAVLASTVEETYDFETNCPRCNRAMVCYGDEDCWCQNQNIPTATLHHFQDQYGNKCLCRKCIQEFVGTTYVDS